VKGLLADDAAPSLITATGLTKRFGRVRALTDLTLSVRTGEVFGLLGPNGSGKTTTIRLLIGLLRPTAGRSSVAGFDSWRRGLEVRRFVSFLPGELRLPGGMTGLKLLKYLCALRGGAGLERAVAIAEHVMELDLRRRIRTYSTGMKQKLALAQAFADPVEVLVLDEPTSSLDPSARGLVLQLVREAKAGGQTVLFSGHVLSEVEQVSDRVAILREGRLMHVEDMHARRNLRMLLIRFRDGLRPEPPAELALRLRGMQGDALLIEHRGEVGPLLSWLAAQPVEDLAIGTEDLRSLYDHYHGPNADGPPRGGTEP
jgi:ABC-2 type transport system ATP-binding protein